MQTPLAHMRRTCTEDTEVFGQTIKAGDKVVLWYISANRDEDVFENPDKLDITRDNARRHLAFGYGIHRCVGARLAELQSRQILVSVRLSQSLGGGFTPSGDTATLATAPDSTHS